MVRRNAFTLIELVFAIVIVAITVLSVPVVLQINSRGVQAGVDQEAVFAASAKLMQTLSYPWDENSSLVTSSGTVDDPQIIIIPGGTASLDCVTRGAISSYRARTCGSPRAVSALGVDDNTSIIGMDERIENNRAMDTNATTLGTVISSAATYKATYGMDVDVLHVMDANATDGTGINYSATNPFNGKVFLFSTGALSGGQASHLKMISVSIKDQNNRVITTLRAYAANIGWAQPKFQGY